MSSEATGKMVEAACDSYMTSTGRVTEGAMERAINAALAVRVAGAQRQDSLIDQLRTVRDLANQAGCYDAADYLRSVIEAPTPPSLPFASYAQRTAIREAIGDEQ